MAGGDRLQLLGQPPVELDRVQMGDPRRDPVAERALPRPDLEHHVAWIEVGVANDRLQQVGVGEEVLIQPYHWNALAAFVSTIRSSAS